jgi:hypothetical protein
MNIEPREPVHFEWKGPGCGATLSEDADRAPDPLPTVWNINS